MKKKNRWWLLITPLYLFTLLFVLGPMIYMVAVSFATNNGDGYGFRWIFTLDNYRKMTDPVYLQCFVQSFELAFATTILVTLIGYPFGYFMAKLSEKGKKRMMFLIMVPFWTSSLIRLYGWIIILQAKGILNGVLKALGLIDKPLKLLYSYPAVLIGMIYALLPFMILAVYSSVEKMDWALVEAARDLGASPFKAFLTVTLKLTLPGLLSGVILTFIPSMGLFFIAAALAVILTILTSLMIFFYRKITHVKDLEGLF